MPLIDLQTNLKSLKYGQDRPDGGNSGQPYIQTDITTADPGLKFDDGFVRGGTVNAAQLGLIDNKRISKFFNDKPKGFLFRTKQVGLQLANPRLEIPKNPANIISGIPDNPLAVGTNGLLEPTRIYNILGTNTLLQIPVNAFGGHFNRHGLLPIQTDASKYEAVVTANNNIRFYSNPSKENRLVKLADKFKLGDRTGNTSVARAAGNIFNTIGNLLGNIPVVSKILNTLKPQDLIIDKYQGGANSVYGVGETLIKRYSFTEDKEKIDKSLSFSRQFAGYTREEAGKKINYFKGLGKGNKAISNYAVNINKPVNLQLNTKLKGVINIPTEKEEQVSMRLFDMVKTDIQKSIDQTAIKYSDPSIKTYAGLVSQIAADQKRPNYNIANVTRNSNGWTTQGQNAVINSQIGSGFSSKDIGKIIYKNSYDETVTINKSSWSAASRAVRVGSGRTDSINLTPLFKNSTGQHSSVVTIKGVPYTINDLVKFRIEAIDTDDPSQSVFMVFRAYLTDLSDSVDATWNDIKYAGRGERFYVYDGFSRKISIGFKVAALSAEEMEPMYQKLNYLMSNLMPDYSDKLLMRGPFVRMTIGNWVDSQPGVLNSLSYTVPQDSPWEIALNEPITVDSVEKKELILPHVVEVRLTFTPIGSQTQTNNKIPEKVKDNNVSHIAQNYNGEDPDEYNYIDDQIIKKANVPYLTLNNTSPLPRTKVADVRLTTPNMGVRTKSGGNTPNNPQFLSPSVGFQPFGSQPAPNIPVRLPF